MFNSQSRKQALLDLKEQTVDLLIVGGGITGAGVAREAAQRGLRVFLAESRDFAVGTSSRSSKLVHGGIRYLENLEFGLVHEALMERGHLLKMAPHMVHPLRFMIPVYKNSRVGLFKLEAGMILYDVLSFFEAPQVHEFHRREATREQEPLLKDEQLTGCVIYSDAYMEDDRLVIETLRSAQRAGAQIANYVEVRGSQPTADGYRVELYDRLAEETVFINTRHLVGCVGPWTDLVAAKLEKDWKNVLRPTKGVHLVFSRERIPVQQAIVMAVEERIVFVIPRGEIVIVGTTDSDYRQNPENVVTESEDVDYLLKVTNNYFPDLHLTAEDVISCYSGVRPLVRDGSSNEGKTSREHEIFKPAPHLTLVAGGKYTTYRAMAIEIVDACLRSFSFDFRMSLRRADTTQPLNPGATEEKLSRLALQADSLSTEFGVSVGAVQYLISRRGEEALDILRRMQTVQGDSEEQRLWLAEAKFSIENEMCLNLVDFYSRRSPLFLFRRDHGRPWADKMAPLFAGLTKSSPQAQLSALDQLIAHDLKAIQALRR